MSVLAIDDDAAQLERLRVFFGRMEYPPVDYRAVETASEGMEILRSDVVDLVLTDLRLGDSSGLEVLARSKALNPLVPVVVMTAFSDAREAVEILKGGADDYLIKPTSYAEIEKVLLRVHEKNLLVREAFLPPSEGPAASPATAGIIYRGAAMANVLRLAARCADSDATVLLNGESGTGKELVARFIHDRSPRRDGPFVPVNISALAVALAESELFGHKRGAFTGASSDRVGRFEEADGGTLFIDEVGDVDPSVQVKLLRAVQFGIVERVGENQPRQLDVRIVCATHRDLPRLVAEGRFRTDLYYRLNVISVDLPPLRARKEDIPVLAEAFVARYNERYGRSVRGFTREAMARLMKHSFPGNVRELENIVERAVVLCPSEYIRERDLPHLAEAGLEAVGDEGRPGFEEAVARYERRLIEEALRAAGGNKSAAARSLGITERHLRSRLARLGGDRGDADSV